MFLKAIFHDSYFLRKNIVIMAVTIIEIIFAAIEGRFRPSEGIFWVFA